MNLLSAKINTTDCLGIYIYMEGGQQEEKKKKRLITAYSVELWSDSIRTDALFFIYLFYFEDVTGSLIG